MRNGEFDNLVREFFDWTMERNPPLATNLGLHQYDGRLPDGSRGAALAEIEGWTRYRQRFAALEPEELSGSRPLDRELALFLLDLWIYLGDELRLWEAIPAAPEVLGSSLLPLLVRDSAPLGDRMARITERLRAAPRFLGESKGRIRRPVKLWGEMALESAKALPSFLAAIGVTAAELGGPASEVCEDARRAAEEALADYTQWLRSEVVGRGSEENTIGPEAFHRLLELRHIEVSPEELRALGHRYLRAAQEELRRIAGQIDPKATIDEVRERLRLDHPPTFEAVLDEARSATVEAREFVQRHHLATLPRAEELFVLATPTFLRHVLPFGAYFGPGRWEAKQQGLFMVTPPVGEAGGGGQGRTALRNMAVHEGYPGHHLQQVCANLNPSLLRQLVGGVANPEVVEGWAHYCEEMMREAGLGSSPEGRFVQVTDVVWRACRLLIDVDLHSDRMGFDGAVELLVREAGMHRDSAVGEVKRYTQNPTYQLSYLLGKQMIKGLRDEVRARMGPRYSDRFFHDTILYSGGLPMVLLKRVFEDKMGVFEEELPE